jgi:hypothetical protein
MDNNPIHEAMLAYWGERCSAYHEECVCCKAWEQYDGKTSAQPAQEPVEDVVEYFADGTRIVRVAPQRPWVGLTSKELNEIFAVASTGEHAVNLAADKLKEKNA